MQNDHRAIADFLQKNRLRLAVAESLTAGLLQSKLAALEGAAGFFSGGITTYQLDLKAGLLGVDRAEAEKTNAVDPQTAEQMARGICSLMESPIGLATTGYAEPDANLGVDVPYAFIACFARIADTSVCRSREIRGEGLNRLAMLAHVAESALALLAEMIRGEVFEVGAA